MRRILVASLLLAALVCASVASAAVSTTVVKLSSLNGWIVDTTILGNPTVPTSFAGPPDSADGDGSLRFGPIGAPNGAKLEMQPPEVDRLVSEFEGFQYEFQILEDAAQGDAEHFYANVYVDSSANGIDFYGSDAETTGFYDCRYSYVPEVSVAGWNTFSFDGATTANGNNASRHASCTTDLEDVPGGSEIIFFRLSAGDTSANDIGLEGAFDLVAISFDGDTTIYDFEPEVQCTTICYVDATNGDDAFGGDTIGSAKKTIQAGVDAVSSGGTVQVAAGTYAENVEIDKALKLAGAGQGETIVVPAATDPFAPPESGSLPTGSSNVILIQSADVEIHDLTVDGDNPALTDGEDVGGANVDARNGIITDHRLAQAFTNVSVHDTTIKNIWMRALYSSTTGGTFSFVDNTLDNVQGTYASIAIFNSFGSGTIQGNHVSNANDAISANWSTGTQFLDNVVTGSASGVHTDNNGGAGGVADLIKGNSVSDGAANSYGIWVFAPYRDVVLEENTITNVDVGMTAAGSFGGVPSLINNVVDGENRANSTAIYVTTWLFGHGDTDMSAIFSNNVIEDVVDGVYVQETAGKVQTATLNGNSFSGITNSLVYNDGTSPFNASANWWGSDGESTIADGMFGDVDFTPFLDIGDDTSADPGFQGDFSVLNVTALGAQTGSPERIQEGVDLVSDSIVNVLPGTYEETVIIDEDGLELRGANYGISPNDSVDPLLPSASRGAESIVAVTGGDIAISVQAEDVVVDGFSFTADDASNANVQSPVIGGGVNFGGDASGIAVRNNIFDAIQRIAVYFNGPDATPMQGATIDDNRVDHPTRPETGCATAPTTAPGGCARQLFNPWKTDDLSFQRNVVISDAGNLDRVRVLNVNGGTGSGGDGVTIADNTIRYTCHFTCITIAGSTTDVEITGNDIVSHHGNAVQLFADWSGAEVDVHHNSFDMTNGDFAVVVDDTAAELSDVHVNRNAFASKGIRNGTDALVAGTDTLDAKCNWWGQATGPDQVSVPPDAFGPTEFAPWLLTSDLGGDCTAISLVTAAADADGDEGDLLIASGKFSNPAATIDADEPFGTFTDNGDGTWDWEYTPPDQFSTVTITVTATDPNGSTETDSFDTSADNVDPTATFNAPADALYDSGFNISLTDPDDAGADDVTAGFTYAFDCGTGYGSTSGTSSGSCTAPSDPGPITVKGKVFDKDGGFTEYTAQVDITQPEAELTPASNSFGNQVVGLASEPFSFTLENVGTADLTVLGVALGGTNPAHFGIDTNGCVAAVLVPGATCDVAVIFQPSSLGAKSATLRVTTDDPDLAVAISNLTGSGVTAASPGSIRIVVDSRPNANQDFAFAGDLGAFILDDDSNPTRQRGRTYLNLAPGEYEITQTTDAAAWSLVAVNCTNPATVTLATRTVTIDLDSNEDIVCTFVNSRRRPDGLISKNNSTFKGGNRYAANPIKRQTQRRNNVAKNTLQKFYVRAQNDSLNADVLRIDANESGAATMSITYWVNGVDQTAAIVAGTYLTSSLNPGQFVTIEVRVAVGNSVNNAARTALVFIRSDSRPGQVDVVRAVTKR